MKSKNCPKCKNVLEPYKYDGVICYSCENCGYDSCEDEVVPQEKTDQKVKARYSPYKSRTK